MNHYIQYADEYLKSKQVLPGRECYSNPNTIRQKVLSETIKAFQTRNNYHSLSLDNLHSWFKKPQSSCDVIVCPLDWGVAALQFTKHYGQLFTVLNMANPHYPGGGYLDGCAAQEENMFRRSDCHFSINETFDRSTLRYNQNTTDLLSAKNNIVYIDVSCPRVCIRSQEDRYRCDLGYEWLPDDSIFPFIEMRASAIDCRYDKFDYNEAERRIVSQFNTLISNNIQYVLLGAFGCGAFNNPSSEIASIYKKCIDKYYNYFKAIIFPIYYPGYGPDNYSIFNSIL